MLANYNLKCYFIVQGNVVTKGTIWCTVVLENKLLASGFLIDVLLHDL